MSKFILLKYSKNNSFLTCTNYFLHNLKKYVKTWLFGMGLNKGLEGHTPPHIKHTIMLNTPSY